MSKPMWMVRSASGGRLADEFVEQKVVAIGWEDIGDLAQYQTKAEILLAIRQNWPDWSQGRCMSSASQLERFRTQLQKDDRVLTYDSSRRIYHVGTLVGDYAYQPDVVPPFENIRRVEWQGEVDRDVLSVTARNSLGSTLTLFRVPEHTVKEIERALQGKSSEGTSASDDDVEEDEESLLDRYKSEAFEIIKDRITRLAWDQMQEFKGSVTNANHSRNRLSLAPSRSAREAVVKAQKRGQYPFPLKRGTDLCLLFSLFVGGNE